MLAVPFTVSASQHLLSPGAPHTRATMASFLETPPKQSTPRLTSTEEDWMSVHVGAVATRAPAPRRRIVIPRRNRQLQQHPANPRYKPVLASWALTTDFRGFWEDEYKQMAKKARVARDILDRGTSMLQQLRQQTPENKASSTNAPHFASPVAQGQRSKRQRDVGEEER